MGLTATNDDDFCGWGEGGEGVGGDGGSEGTEVVLAITTEKMSYKNDQDAAWSILVVGVQALEGILLPVLIQHRQVGDFLQVSFGRGIIVDLDVPFEISRRVFHSHLVERGIRTFADSIKPKDEGYEGKSE